MSLLPPNTSRNRPLLVILLTLVIGGCSVGSSRQEVSTPFGYKLDCTTESITSASGQVMPGTVGSESAQQAIDTFNGEARPPGEPSVEAQAEGKVVYVFTDEDGNRLGRLFVAETEQGWFVLQMERCDEEP